MLGSNPNLSAGLHTAYALRGKIHENDEVCRVEQHCFNWNHYKELSVLVEQVKIIKSSPYSALLLDAKEIIIRKIKSVPHIAPSGAFSRGVVQ